MQKSRKKPPAKKSRKRELKPTIPQSVEAKPQPISYFGHLKLLLKDVKLLSLLALIAVGVGIAIQVNWVQLRCPTEPFFGSQVTICKDNMLRLILGGPLVFVLSLPVAALIRHLNPELTSKGVMLVFVLLLPLCALPWIKTEAGKSKLMAADVAMFLGAIIYLTREKLWEGIWGAFAKPKFTVEIKNADNLSTIVLSGELDNAEKNWIYESLIDMLVDINWDEKEVRVDVSNLNGYNSGFSFVFLLLAGLVARRGQRAVLIGNPQLITEINRSLKFEFSPLAHAS